MFRSLDFISMLSHVVLYFQAKSDLYLNVFYFYDIIIIIIIIIWLASSSHLVKKRRNSDQPSGEILSVKENLV